MFGYRAFFSKEAFDALIRNPTVVKNGEASFVSVSDIPIYETPFLEPGGWKIVDETGNIFASGNIYETEEENERTVRT